MLHCRSSVTAELRRWNTGGGVPASGAGYMPRLLVQQREEVGLVLTGVWFGPE